MNLTIKICCGVAGHEDLVSALSHFMSVMSLFLVSVYLVVVRETCILKSHDHSQTHRPFVTFPNFQSSSHECT